MLAAAAVGVGAAAARQQLRRPDTASEGGATRSQRHSTQLQASRKLDWLGTSTGWDDMEDKPLTELDWKNVHGLFAICSALLFLGQCVRIALHQEPTIIEAWVATAIYLPWCAVGWRDTAKLESHYQVTFYASCGWAIMSLASLHSMFLQDKQPELAFGILCGGNLVFLASCVYFYGYHWSRMWRHYQQNRFRPLWIPGLVGLMALHGLTVADFAKRLDDGGWWKIVCQVYPDEWWWVADVRVIELFVTAAALWLIILHIKGVFTGMKNAIVVVTATIFAPLAVMVWESYFLRASAWQHYLMVGPKYW